MNKKHQTHKIEKSNNVYYPCYWNVEQQRWIRYRQNDVYVARTDKQEALSWLSDAKVSEKAAGII